MANRRDADVLSKNSCVYTMWNRAAIEDPDNNSRFPGNRSHVDPGSALLR